MVSFRIHVGNFTIDKGRFEAWAGEERIDLTFVEFELLHILARNAGKVVPRPRLVLSVWNEQSHGDDRKLTVHLSRLRKKLRASGSEWQIETVKKRGYMFAPPAGHARGELQPRLDPAGSGRT